MKTIVALQAWNNFSEYYSKQVGKLVSREFDMTVTYNQDSDYLNQFDIIWSFFPHFPPKENVSKDKIVKTFWEPHEMGLTRGKVNVACSTNTYRHLLKSDVNAIYAPFGVNTDHFYPKATNNERIVVGWCGELANRRKQFPQLEAVMNKISEIDFKPNSTVNKGGYLIGKYLKTEDMVDYYNSIDIYVCGSANEGFGLPLLEASACGKPIVTFNVGIASELKHDGAGVIIVDTFMQMKEVVTNLAKNREKIKMLGEKSHKAVLQNWQWNKFEGLWLKVFRAI